MKTAIERKHSINLRLLDNLMEEAVNKCENSILVTLSNMEILEYLIDKGYEVTNMIMINGTTKWVEQSKYPFSYGQCKTKISWE